MGSYAYCRKCDAGLDNPTFKESVLMKIECHNCGCEYDLGHDESTQALINLEERITAIEQHLGITT